MTTELEARATATTRRIFTLPVGSRGVRFVIDRGTGPSARCLFIGGPCWFPASQRPPAMLE